MPRAEPAAPRLAATVLLLRSAVPGFEVFLQRRSAGMAFAAGMYVFPGGAVDPQDYRGEPVGGADWPARLGRPLAEAQAVVRAAVRELQEETGVRVAARDLLPWARWITPESEPRRYDTYFFVAGLPAGESPAEPAGESDHSLWLRPADARTLPMLPPTAAMCADLAGFDTVPDVLAADRDAATPVRPRVERGPDGRLRLVTTADDVAFPRTSPRGGV